jgi:DNA-binding PadR family transcriptional regulator
MSTEQLSPTSFLVLGLLAREGPSTPYELKRHVAETLGAIWSFPHALLYAEPPRLVAQGLATEDQEPAGRRRRTFTITDEGLDSLQAWLERPSRESPELRDIGLLQLLFANVGSQDTRRQIATDQLAIHRTKLAGFEQQETSERVRAEPDVVSGKPQRWRGQALHMGVLYERAAVEFWEGVGIGVAAEQVATGGGVADVGSTLQ